MIDLITTLFDDYKLLNILERLAGFINLQRLLAWLIHPARETYIAMGPHRAPRPCQHTIPHPQWMDSMGWGGLRDAIIATDEFQLCYGTNLRLLNWTGTLEDALALDPQTGALRISDLFSQHVSKAENWALDIGFVQRYPELRGFVKVWE